jgi:acyl carrier protein
MDEFIEDIKVLIIETLDLEEVTPEDIDVEAPLFDEGLGLDSIDALELGVAIQKRYGVMIDANTEGIKNWFQSVATLSQLIKMNRTI